MIIRKAQEKDFPFLLAIYNYEVLNGTASFDLEPKTSDEWMEWFHMHNVDNHPLLTAEVDGCVAGYACLSAYRPRKAYDATVELSVYVDPRYRRQGVASGLMTEILALARAREDIHSVISVITGNNEASLKLHEHFDFEYCGTLKEVGEKFGCLLDVVHMQLMV